MYIVYTAASPQIQTTPQTDPPSHESNLLPADADAEIAGPVASKSGQSTPQASRRVSASGAPDTITPPTEPSAPPSPKQQQRSSSSPLPTRNNNHNNMVLDIQQTFKNSVNPHLNGQDSPVMNETLSVIDEHITDLSTPRHSLAPPDLKAGNDSGSEYSANLGHRMSYINGHETDEEEESHPTEDQVRKWGPQETAKRLREVGIDEKHCDIFEEQEITGDVLLDMDQDFLFMKEFDFGVMGRRLKTWHKVKAFQEEVKGFRPSSSYPTMQEERSASRAGHTGTFLPRIPIFSEKSAGGFNQSRASSTSTSAQQSHSRLSSIQSDSSYGTDIPGRPSAASIRGINHSRRHSSIDTTNRSFDLTDSPPRASHQIKPSFDRTWSMAGGQRLAPRPDTSLGTSTAEGVFPLSQQQQQQQSTRATDVNECDSAISVTDRYDDLDRGYFSGPEGDTKKKNRRVLMKRSSAKSGSLTHSRKSSYTDDSFKPSMDKRHSRIGSIDSIRDAANRISKPSSSSGAPSKSRLRSLSIRLTDRSGHTSQSSNPPSAEDKSSGAATGFFSSFAPLVGGKSGITESPARSSPAPFKNAGPKFRRPSVFVQFLLRLRRGLTLPWLLHRRPERTTSHIPRAPDRRRHPRHPRVRVAVALNVKAQRGLEKPRKAVFHSHDPDRRSGATSSPRKKPVLMSKDWKRRPRKSK